MADEAIITPLNNGPYHVIGHFKIVMPGGRELETEGETWLCRCGGSTNKPFCDGTHSKIGFMAAEAAVSKAESGGDSEEFVPVADESAVGEGDLIGVEVDGEPVVIGRVEGQVYAIGGVCSHQFALLEEGGLEDNVVMCPLHDSGFDIRTGKAVRLPATAPVLTYDVKVEGGKILVSRQPTPRA